MVKAPVSGKAPAQPAPRKRPAANAKPRAKPSVSSDPHAPTTEAEHGLLIAIDGDGMFDAGSLELAQRVVRPTFLRSLLLGKIEGKCVPETGLLTFDLVFEDILDLSYLSNSGEALPPLWLDAAHFKKAAKFDHSRLSMISMDRAEADAGLSMAGLSTLGLATLRCLKCCEGLSLHTANIGGQLSLNGARLKGTVDAEGRVNGNALLADGAVIKGGVFCVPAGDHRFEAQGEIRLLGADIGGQLCLSGAHLKGAVDASGHVTGDALSADGAIIKGIVACNPSGNHRFEAEGMVRLLGASIGGGLDLNGARLKGAVGVNGYVSGSALNADRAVITGGVFCRPSDGHRFEAEGEFRFLGATIDGQLNLRGAYLKGAAEAGGRVIGDALSADGAVIKGGVFCDLIGNHRFEAEGLVRLPSTLIGGQLSLKGARLKGAVEPGGRVTGPALSFDGAVISGAVFCDSSDDQRFEATGVVRLSGADILGQLSMKGARLKGSVDTDGCIIGAAVLAQRIKVGGVTFMDDDIEALGTVIFKGAMLNDLCLQGEFHGSAPGDCALDLRDAEIRRLVIRLNACSGSGRIHLEGAFADTIDDLDPQSWGSPPNEKGDGLELDLDGFTYRRAEVSVVLRDRTRKWARFLARDPVAENVLDLLDRSFRAKKPCRDHYSPQPFEQAVKALRETGYSRAADEVAVAKREFHRQCGADGPVAAFMSGVSLIFFRYGYGPLRASAWTVAFALLGAGLVWLGQASDLLVTTVEPGQTAIRCAEIPLSLALDTFLPLVDFGVEARCRVATGLPWSGAAEAFRVTYAIIGWLFIPMVALTFSGLLRRD